MIPFQVIDVEKEMVDLNDSCGKISGASVIPYPPGVPVLSIGELIDKNVIQVIKYYIKNSMDLIGVKDNKIKVVK